MLKNKHWLVILDCNYGNPDEREPKRLRQVVAALDEITAVARVGYRLGKHLTDLEIVSVVVKEA